MYHNNCIKMGLLLFLTILGIFGIGVTANVIDNTSMKSHNDHVGGSNENMKSHQNVNESHDRCSEVFETYPEADCILYDDEICDGAEGIKVMKSGDVATKIKETYNFTVESISIKKDHKLTIYKGNLLNGESKEFVADESDMHVSDEDLKSFYDNVNSAACVRIDTTPGDRHDNNQHDHANHYAQKDQSKNASNEIGNNLHHDNHHDHHDGGCHGHHGGVSLASFRWCEYGPTVKMIVVLMVAGIMKILFHHLSSWIAKLSELQNNSGYFCSQLLRCITIVLKAIESLPESCVLILFGAICGSIILLVNPEQNPDDILFTPFLFFNVLLPPIIMDSAFAIYNKDFGSNFGTILIFAVAGTIFNIFTIGGGLILVDMAGGFNIEPSLCDSPFSVLTFSSLIAAVDPVAVLAIFQEIGVKVSLYFLVFGESLLNDGVTIVVYNTMVGLSSVTPVATDYVIAFFSFFTVVFGGFLLGVTMGFISSFIVKFTRHCRELEPFTIIVSTYLAFVFAELFHWSGIIGILGCGIVQKRYAFRNISKKSFWTIKYGVKTMATFADCVIFIFLGLVSVDNVKIWNSFNIGFVAMTCFLCTLFRFTGVLFFSFLVNKSSHLDPISLKEQLIMAYGGLRGGVGFSLAQILTKDNPFKDLFLTTAIFMVYFTTFLQGGTIKWLVSVLSIDKAEEKESRIFDDVHDKTLCNLMSGVESVATCEMHRNKAQLLFAKYDEKYIQKWVLHDEAVDLMVLKVQKFAMEDHYARLYGPRVMAKKSIVASMRARSPSDFNRDSLEDSKIIRVPDAEDPVVHRISTSDQYLGKKESKRILANAFASHPFSKYQTCDRVKMESNDDLQNLIKHEEERSSHIWKTAFTKVRHESVIGKSSEEENLDDGKKKMDISTILKLYRRSKEEKTKDSDSDSD